MATQGIYVEMAHHPQAILDAMAGMEEAAARSQVLQQLLQYLTMTLMFTGIGGFVVVFSHPRIFPRTWPSSFLCS